MDKRAMTNHPDLQDPKKQVVALPQLRKCKKQKLNAEAAERE
jgi:hypothetical protein